MVHGLMYLCCELRTILNNRLKDDSQQEEEFNSRYRGSNETPEGTRRRMEMENKYDGNNQMVFN